MSAIVVRKFEESIAESGPQEIQVPKFALTENERFGLRLKLVQLHQMLEVVDQPGFALTTPEQVAWANEAAHRAADSNKAIEASRKRQKRLWSEQADACDAALMPLEKLSAELKRKLGAHIATALEAENQKRAAAFQLAAAAHLAGQHQEAAQQLQVASASAAQAKVEGFSARKVWKFRVVNATLVERQWCVPDERMIGAMVRATPSNSSPQPIGGVEYFLENETRTT